MPPWSAQEQRGKDDPIGPGTSSPTWQQKQQLNSLEGLINLGTLGAYRPIKRGVVGAVKGAYNTAYGNPARQIKAGYENAASNTRAAGQRAAGAYGDARQRSMGYYGGAQSVFDSYGGTQTGYQPPPNPMRSTYGGTGAGGGARGAALSGLSGGMGTSPSGGGFGTPTPRASTTGTPIYGGGGPSTQLQDYYSNFNSYQPTLAQDYFSRRQQTGYGPNPLMDRYNARAGAPDDSRLDSRLGMLESFATGGTNAEGRMTERRNLGPDALDARMTSRQQFANQPTSTARVNTDLNERVYDAQSGRTQSMMEQMQGGVYAGLLENEMRDGTTAGGRMLSSLVSGDTAGGRMRTSMASGEGDSGRFLAGFDPNATRGLEDTYNRLASEGPTYEEDFYLSQLNGENPAFNQLKGDFIKDQRRSAAARGGFVSGRAMDLEQRGLSRLTADEFANRGALAGQAGQARRSQLDQLLSGATALDENLLGRSSLVAETGLGRERILADLASSGDAEAAGLAGTIDTNRRSLAESRDSREMDRLSEIGALARNRDSENRLGLDLRLRGAGQQDNLLRDDQDALDSLGLNLSNRDANRNTALDTLAMDSDGTRTTRMSNLGTQLSTSDINRETRRTNLDALSGDANTSLFDREKQMDTLADRAAGEAGDTADRRLDAADKASSEKFTQYKERFDQAMRMGDARTAIDQVYTMAEQGVITSTELSAIGHEMARAGVDAATIQAVIGDAITILKEVGKAAASGGRA